MLNHTIQVLYTNKEVLYFYAVCLISHEKQLLYSATIMEGAAEMSATDNHTTLCIC